MRDDAKRSDALAKRWPTTPSNGPSANIVTDRQSRIHRSSRKTLDPARAQAWSGQPIPARSRTDVEVALAGDRRDLLARREADDVEGTGTGFNKSGSAGFR